MDKKLFIPEKLKVGFQTRTDTYTKKLGYVIYFDEKGTLRKEKSWESWRSKDIVPLEIENTPIEGFVLNKNGGGNGRGWDSRQAFVRVWDPRDFEFEISVDNLLFILRLCDCSKGKGLEGQFVYSWDGTDLVLLPVSSEDYIGSCIFTDYKTKNIGLRELKIGTTYKTKNLNKLIYLGKFDYHTINNTCKKLVFYNLKTSKHEYYINAKHLAIVFSEEIPENFHDLVEEYYKSRYGSKVSSLYIRNRITKDSYYSYDYIIEKNKNNFIVKRVYSNNINYNPPTKIIGKIIVYRTISINEGNIITSYFDKQEEIFYQYQYKKGSYYEKEWIKIKEPPDIQTFQELVVVLESGTELLLEKYERGY